MPRPSLHIEPTSPLQIARHYVRELIYGANDGIITTFAVVAGGGMFVVGALRALIADVRWWKAGVEMLGLGGVVAMVAYASGGFVARLLEGG